jgi:hypothetical protein
MGRGWVGVGVGVAVAVVVAVSWRCGKNVSMDDC